MKLPRSLQLFQPVGPVKAHPAAETASPAGGYAAALTAHTLASSRVATGRWTVGRGPGSQSPVRVRPAGGSVPAAAAAAPPPGNGSRGAASRPGAAPVLVTAAEIEARALATGLLTRSTAPGTHARDGAESRRQPAEHPVEPAVATPQVPPVSLMPPRQRVMANPSPPRRP